MRGTLVHNLTAKGANKHQGKQDNSSTTQNKFTGGTTQSHTIIRYERLNKGLRNQPSIWSKPARAAIRTSTGGAISGRQIIP